MYLITFKDGNIDLKKFFPTYRDAYQYARENYAVELCEQNKVIIKKFDDMESVTKFVCEFILKNIIETRKIEEYQENLYSFLTKPRSRYTENDVSYYIY